jgi:ABC-type bacteriocin/lantibiotic exporter with double-glycine peptidase domain
VSLAIVGMGGFMVQSGDITVGTLIAFWSTLSTMNVSLGIDVQQLRCPLEVGELTCPVG